MSRAGWWVLALVLLALGGWGRASGMLVRLLADDDQENASRSTGHGCINRLLVGAMSSLLIMGTEAQFKP